MALISLSWANILFGAALIVIFSAPYWGKSILAGIDGVLSGAQLTETNPQSVRGVPLEKLQALAREIESFGFKHLISYEVPSGAKFGMDNFSMVHHNSEGWVCEICYIRCPWIMRIFQIIFTPTKVHNYSIGTEISVILPDYGRLTVGSSKHSVTNIAKSDKTCVLNNACPTAVLSRFKQEFADDLKSGKTLPIRTPSDFRTYFERRLEMARREMKALREEAMR